MSYPDIFVRLVLVIVVISNRNTDDGDMQEVIEHINRKRAAQGRKENRFFFYMGS
jgi:hypothetical protein